jgi:hypothetical protein
MIDMSIDGDVGASPCSKASPTLIDHHFDKDRNNLRANPTEDISIDIEM